MLKWVVNQKPFHGARLIQGPYLESLLYAGSVCVKRGESGIIEEGIFERTWNSSSVLFASLLRRIIVSGMMHGV